jgi:CHASE2 domain
VKRLAAWFRLRAGLGIWTPAAVVLTYYVLLLFDPFGIGAASHARSEQATLRIMAPFYTPAKSGAAVAVVIDDEYLRSRGSGWPLRYAEQGRILRQLLAVQPALVLVDLVYPHRHGQDDSDPVSALIDPIRSNTDIPVILTALAKNPTLLPEGYEFCRASLAEGATPALLDPQSLQPELLALHYDIGYVGWSGCGSAYPLLLGGDVQTPTPAFAAYRRFCSDHRQQASCPRGEPATHAARFAQPMIVRAGAFPPAHQGFAYGAVCQPLQPERGEPPTLHKLRMSVQQLVLSLFRDPRDNPDPEVSLPCPAVTVLPLSALANAPRKDWEELLSGRIVVLGANITGIPDVLDAPVHGQIPGVVWHAMAIDNLLALGPGYLANRHPLLQRVLGIALVTAFAYALPFLLRWLEHPRLKRVLAAASLPLWFALAAIYLGSGDNEAALTALALGIGFDLIKPTSSAVYLVGIGAAALGSLLLLQRGWPPENWLGLVFVLVAFAGTIKPYYHGEERKQFPSRYSLLYRCAVAARKRP